MAPAASAPLPTAGVGALTRARRAITTVGKAVVALPYRLRFAALGRSPLIVPPLLLQGAGRVHVGDRVRMERFAGLSGLFANSDMGVGEIDKFCTLSKEARQLIDLSVRRMQLSARAYHRVLKLSRTIADLADSDRIEIQHAAEAIQYRSLDRRVDF